MTTDTKVKTAKTVNGVSLNDLHGTIKAIRGEPALGKAVFRASNKWLGRALNRTTIGNYYCAGAERSHKKPFVFDNDEGDVLLGEDNGANPVEFVLHALAGCVTTTTVYHAAARGITIDELETTLEGDLDLQGMFALDPKVPSGYQNIRVTMKIKSDAPPEKLEELKNFYKLSPVFGTLTSPVNVAVRVEA